MVSLTSCDLTTENPSAFDSSFVFSNYDLAEFNNFSIYEVFGHTNCHRGRYLPWYGFNTDIELYTSTNSDSKSDIARYDMLPNNDQLNLSNGPFNELFVGVERANLCIQNLRLYGDVQNKPDMAYLLGEALVARALLYTELLKAYGEVPARFEPITPETIYLPKSDRDVIYKQLLADLEESFSYLPWPGTTSATMKADRPNLAFAKGLYARLALMASGKALRPDTGMVNSGNTGSVRLSEDADLSKETLYPKIFVALKDVIDNSGLDLEKDYEKFWKGFNNFDISTGKGKELIFSIPMGDVRGRWNYTFAVVCEKGVSSFATITTKRGGTAGPVPTLYWKYGENDQRRDVSCVNYKWEHDEKSKKDVQVLAGPGNWYFGKYRFEWMQNVPYTGGNDDGIKPVYMRYSDILLMAAEVAADAAAGEYHNLDVAKSYLKEVRERAYAGHESEAAAYVDALTADTFLEAIKEERALEFVGEMLRKVDLIRWGELKTRMDAAKDDLAALAAGSAPYNTFGPAVWYKYAEDGQTLITYGYKPGEIADKMAGPGKGWTCYTDSNGSVVDYFTEIEDKKINSFYDRNPDERQWWPIPEATITTSQGALVNDYDF